jgi:hypothetical protein
MFLSFQNYSLPGLLHGDSRHGVKSPKYLVSRASASRATGILRVASQSSFLSPYFEIVLLKDWAVRFML